MTFQFLWFLYMYELEFYSKDEPPLLSYLFIHPLIYLLLDKLMDVYFILYVITHCCYMDIFAIIAMYLAIVHPRQAGFCALLLCPIPLQSISFSYCESPVPAGSCALLLRSIPLQSISLILQVGRCSTLICVFPAPALELAIFHSCPNFHTILIVRLLITLFIILEN